MNKPKLISYFNTLANVYNSTLNENQKDEIKFEPSVNAIDEHLFIEAIALCALDIPYR